MTAYWSLVYVFVRIFRFFLPLIPFLGLFGFAFFSLAFSNKSLPSRLSRM